MTAQHTVWINVSSEEDKRGKEFSSHVTQESTDTRPWNSLPLVIGACWVPSSCPCLPFLSGRDSPPTISKNSRYSHLLSQTPLQCHCGHVTRCWQMRPEGKSARELLGRAFFQNNKDASALSYSRCPERPTWQGGEGVKARHKVIFNVWLHFITFTHQWETEALSQTFPEELNLANN